MHSTEYEKALAIRRNLVAANPRDPNLQFELLGTMLNLARISEQFGDLAARWLFSSNAGRSNSD